MPLTGAVSDAMSASMARSPRASITAMPWSPMVPESITRSPGRTGGERPAVRDDPDARRRDEQAVGGALGHHLRVAGDDLHARGLGRLRHVGDDRPQLRDREALLQHERRREPPRHRARPSRGRSRCRARRGGRSSRPGSAAAARRTSRWRTRAAPADGSVEHGAVAELLQLLVAERLDEHRVDQRGRRLAAGAVRERDDLVAQPWPASAERLDALDDLRSRRRSGPVVTSAPRLGPGPRIVVARSQLARGRRPRARSRRGPAPPGSGGRSATATVKHTSTSALRRELAAVVARRTRRCTCPAACASRNAAIRSSELPLVDMATAMSPGPARAISWRAKTSSKPTSLPSAVRIAWSAASDQAGSGRPRAGRANSDCERGGVGGAAAVAEREQPPARARTGRPSRRRPRSRPARRYASSVASRRRALSVGLRRVRTRRGRRAARPGRAPRRRGRGRGSRSCRRRHHASRDRASPRVDEQQVARRDRVDQRDVDDLLDARAVRTRPGSPGVTTSPSRPSSLQVMHTVVGALRRLGQQPGVLEADVGELPQQVVEQHEPAGGGHQRVVGRRATARGRRAPAAGAGSGADPERGGAPRRGAAHRRRDGGLVRRRRRPARRRRAGRTSGPCATRSGPTSATAGSARLPDDHRMHELDGDVLGVRLPLRGETPHRRARVEAAGERTVMRRRDRRPAPTLVATAVIHCLLPAVLRSRARMRRTPRPGRARGHRRSAAPGGG